MAISTKDVLEMSLSAEEIQIVVDMADKLCKQIKNKRNPEDYHSISKKSLGYVYDDFKKLLKKFFFMPDIYMAIWLAFVARFFKELKKAQPQQQFTSGRSVLMSVVNLLPGDDFCTAQAFYFAFAIKCLKSPFYMQSENHYAFSAGEEAYLDFDDHFAFRIEVSCNYAELTDDEVAGCYETHVPTITKELYELFFSHITIENIRKSQAGRISTVPMPMLMDEVINFASDFLSWVANIWPKTKTEREVDSLVYDLATTQIKNPFNNHFFTFAALTHKPDAWRLLPRLPTMLFDLLYLYSDCLKKVPTANAASYVIISKFKNTWLHDNAALALTLSQFQELLEHGALPFLTFKSTEKLPLNIEYCRQILDKLDQFLDLGSRLQEFTTGLPADDNSFCVYLKDLCLVLDKFLIPILKKFANSEFLRATVNKLREFDACCKESHKVLINNQIGSIIFQIASHEIPALQVVELNKLNVMLCEQLLQAQQVSQRQSELIAVLEEQLRLLQQENLTKQHDVAEQGVGTSPKNSYDVAVGCTFFEHLTLQVPQAASSSESEEVRSPLSEGLRTSQLLFSSQYPDPFDGARESLRLDGLKNKPSI